MTTDCATLNNNIATAIKTRLMKVDVLPPTEAVPRLSRELTEVVFAELKNSGITRQALENLGAATSKAAAKALRT
jgi:hypothetical protein